MWVRHGGLDRAGHDRRHRDRDRAAHRADRHVPRADPAPADVSRARGSTRFGRDRLTYAHRWVGFATVWLIVAHCVFTTLGFAMADGVDPVGEAWTAHHDLGLRPDGDREPAACSSRSRSARSGSPARSSPTRPGTASTSTPTSRSRWVRPSARRRHGLRRRPDRPDLLDRALRRHDRDARSRSGSAGRSSSTSVTGSGSATWSRKPRASSRSTSPATTSNASRSEPVNT